MEAQLQEILRRLESLPRIETKLEVHDRRFDAMDSRLDAMDQRFDGIDRRFDAMDHKMEDGFSAVYFEMHQEFNIVYDRMERFEESLRHQGVLLERVVSSIQLIADGFKGHTERLEDHDFRIGTLEKRAS